MFCFALFFLCNFLARVAIVRQTSFIDIANVKISEEIKMNISAITCNWRKTLHEYVFARGIICFYSWRSKEQLANKNSVPQIFINEASLFRSLDHVVCRTTLVLRKYDKKCFFALKQNKDFSCLQFNNLVRKYTNWGNTGFSQGLASLFRDMLSLNVTKTKLLDRC